MSVRRAAIASLLVVACRGESSTSPPPPPPPPPPPAIDAGPAVEIASPIPDAEPPPDALVDVTAFIPTAILDMHYATDHNFTGKAIYPVARCLLRRAVAERLAQAEHELARQGRRIVLWDCYRPAALQKILWELVKDPRYVAEPKYDAHGVPLSGSKHSRGAAVDISLADASGQPLAMPTEHDDFSSAAHRDHARRSAAAAELARLDAAMTAAGFVGMPTEWWHYDARDAERYPLADVPLQ